MIRGCRWAAGMLLSVDTLALLAVWVGGLMVLYIYIYINIYTHTHIYIHNNDYFISFIFIFIFRAPGHVGRWPDGSPYYRPYYRD